MRTTIVPAQITTVEDKIAGNLNLTQVFLLLTPIFFGSIIYLIFPPQLHFSLYKLPIILFIALIACFLAIRIKGRVIIQWIVILLRFNRRPRYYIANKNDEYHREIVEEIAEQNENLITQVVDKKEKQQREDTISIKDIFKFEQFIFNPKSNMKFTFAKKGRMYVTLTEIKN